MKSEVDKENNSTLTECKTRIILPKSNKGVRKIWKFLREVFGNKLSHFKHIDH